MPTIPDAASYVAPLGTGFHLGLQYRQAQERKREALVDEAAKQQQLGMAQQEQAIRNAQAAREAQDYIATQRAQASLPARVQELMAPSAAPTQEGDIPAEERGVPAGHGLTQEQAQKQAMAEFLARTPASQWNHIAPVQAAAAREAYYEGMPEARAKVAEVNAEGRKTVAEIVAQTKAAALEEAARHNQELEAMRKAASEKGLKELRHPETGKFIGYESVAGAPHFMPTQKEADPVATALAGGAAAAPVETPPVPSKKEQLKVGASYRLSDGRIGKWNGTKFVLGE